MKLLTLSLFAFALFAQTNETTAQAPAAPPATAPVTPKPAAATSKPVSRADGVEYQSYDLKAEIVQRRGKEDSDKKVAELQQVISNTQATIANLGREQAPVHVRICKAAELAETCIIAQDPKTGEWSASAPPAPVEPVTPAKAK